MRHFSGFYKNCRLVKRYMADYTVLGHKYNATNITLDIDEKGDCLIVAHFKDSISIASDDKIVFLAKIDAQGLYFKGDTQAVIDDDWFYIGSSNIVPYNGTPGGYGDILINIESESHMFAENDFMITAFLSKSFLSEKGMIQI